MDASPEVTIRPSLAGDVPALKHLYHEAFPGENLAPLVIALLNEPAGTLSLVATRDAAIVGHVILTRCRIAGTDAAVSLLAPLAVASAEQKRGIGSALVREGLRREADRAVARVFVLGDPAYYARLGFVVETDVMPPFPLVEAWRPAWQSAHLRGNAIACQGRLDVPGPWQRRELWSP